MSESASKLRTSVMSERTGTLVDHESAIAGHIDGETVGAIVQEYQVSEVNMVLLEIQHELSRIDELKDALISTKRQIKRAIFGEKDNTRGEF